MTPNSIEILTQKLDNIQSDLLAAVKNATRVQSFRASSEVAEWAKGAQLLSESGALGPPTADFWPGEPTRLV